ncbi:MAG: hypothetical protein A2Y17_02865 [Clostridiales bacterium GWF2_38_85]|nr:MAG: hypothetical protein A2Y17_02865 [Clostridiales bacterium GWF2_38_85]
MNRNKKKLSILYTIMPISRNIILWGIIFSTILCAVGFIIIGKGIDSSWLQLKMAVYTQRIIVEYYLLCITESLIFGFAANYILL